MRLLRLAFSFYVTLGFSGTLKRVTANGVESTPLVVTYAVVNVLHGFHA